MDQPVNAAEPRLADTAPGRRLSIRKLTRIGIGVVLLIIGVVFAIRYWYHSTLYVSTDNAYVNANIVQVAAQVSGPLSHLAVQDQQHVKAGDLLFEIDPKPFRLALNEARAQLALARQSVDQRNAAVAAARAQLEQRRAELENARSNDRRTRNLIAGGFLSAQTAEATHTQARTAEAAVSSAQAQLTEALSALGPAGNENAEIQVAEARVARAQLDVTWTRVSAPISGTVANLTMRPGGTITAQAPLFSIISDEEFWVDANFKETQLSRVQPGQRARVVTDMYPNFEFDGVVQSLSGGSGAAFSLLPPENATGNWVKVTQRVPVRVRIENPDPDRPLRVGTTASVQVRAR